MSYAFDVEYEERIAREENPRWFIDESFSAEESVVLRYRKLHSFQIGLPELAASSIREGCRVFPFMRYRAVEISLLDAVSLSATGTFKAIDACVVSALAKQAGITKCALASGGNTGFARARYAERLGIETYWFYPADNEYLIPAEARTAKGIHLFPIEDPGKVKAACNGFVATHPDVALIPVEWKTSSFESLGGFIAEKSVELGGFDWVAQTVSAAFAPLAYCRVLKQLVHTGVLAKKSRFLGVQQQENCFMYKAWKKHEQQGPIATTNDLLLPVIFDTEPHTYRTQEQFFSLLREHQGDLNTISREEFGEFESNFVPTHGLIAALRSNGVPVKVAEGRLQERAGFVALAGVLKAIDAGEIAPGSRVLSVLSGC